MVARFWVGFVLFHAGLAGASVWIARRWARRLSPGTPAFNGLRAAAGDALLWATSALALALLAAVLGSNGFTAVRLLSQALFGELIVLAAWIAALLWRRGHRPWAAGLALAGTLLLAAYTEAYHREPTDLQVRRYAVDLSQGRRVRGQIRIVQLSDIQADRIGPYEEGAIRTAAEQQADLVVLTGDYVQPRVGGSRQRATGDLNRLLRHVPFEARLGAFAVRGDVDMDWPEVFEGTRITPLSGELVTRPLAGGATLCLIGLTRRMSHGRDAAGMLALVAQAPTDSLRIVAGHGPDFVSELAGVAPIGLALAGHTHGGQVVLPWLGAPYTKSRLPSRYASGLHDYAGVPIHVSAGIGMERGTAPQIRFLCPPEISVLDVTY